MKLNNLGQTNSGNKKRVGRGQGSGRGKTAGRGTKGQKSRSGGNIRPGFEGGQTPLILRVPKKRGFKSRAQKPQTVKVSQLNKFKEGETITKEKLFDAGFIKDVKANVKLLADKRFEVSGLKIEIEKGSSKALADLKKNNGLLVEKSKK